ncbi:MarR family winged helix-turn-helix transcriptional regulator [Rhodococcus koreensis]|uniref:DNA-binding transcriptional regulator, MarR family n=1 Tax=Rhodococcus koreensis TaxID=99653 RepID=A0A1H4VV94_9NOCA|nr:MarR family winged helix-turn-helix transcriptional regulator [Rhodococcus koreensis]SEC85029.1 DNA-binding transcriptional regulator, MarR family [Rhodococcus koreensis]
MVRPTVDHELGFLLARASAILVRSTNAALSRHGLRVRSYTALSLVCDAPAGVHQRRVGAVMGLDPSQLVLLLDELEGDGLVVRTADPSDRRHKLIVATEAGHSVCAQARHSSDHACRQHFGGEDEDLAHRMREVLHRAVFSADPAGTSRHGGGEFG